MFTKFQPFPFEIFTFCIVNFIVQFYEIFVVANFEYLLENFNRKILKVFILIVNFQQMFVWNYFFHKNFLYTLLFFLAWKNSLYHFLLIFLILFTLRTFFSLHFISSLLFFRFFCECFFGFILFFGFCENFDLTH